MSLASLTRPELIFPALECSDRTTLLKTLADRLASAGVVASSSDLYANLLEREEIESTAFGNGVAIPHCKMDGLSEVHVAVAVVPEGVDFAAADGEPVCLFFCIVSPMNSPVAHLQSLAQISKWIQSTDRVQGLLVLDEATDIFSYLSTTES